MAAAEDCGCGKNPQPLGRPAPGSTPPKSLIASVGGATYVAPDGTRTTGLDTLGAAAAVARHGGRVE